MSSPTESSSSTPPAVVTATTPPRGFLHCLASDAPLVVPFMLSVVAGQTYYVRTRYFNNFFTAEQIASHRSMYGSAIFGPSFARAMFSKFWVIPGIGFPISFSLGTYLGESGSGASGDAEQGVKK